MSDTLVKDIQNAVETAYAELLKTNPNAKLDRKKLYNDQYIEKVNASIETLIDFAIPRLKGTDLVKMWANGVYTMSDMRGAHNRAYRIVYAWIDLVEHGDLAPFIEEDYVRYVTKGVRPAFTVRPSRWTKNKGKSEPKPKVPKSEPIPEPETQPDPPAEVGEGVDGAIFDSDTLMEFYEDEPEVIIQTVPAESSEESEPEPKPEPYDYRALAQRIRESGNISN